MTCSCESVINISVIITLIFNINLILNINVIIIRTLFPYFTFYNLLKSDCQKQLLQFQNLPNFCKNSIAFPLPSICTIIFKYSIQITLRNAKRILNFIMFYININHFEILFLTNERNIFPF